VQGGSEFLLDQAIKQSGYDGCVLYDPGGKNINLIMAGGSILVDEFGIMARRGVCHWGLSPAEDAPAIADVVNVEPYGIRVTESVDEGGPSTGESSAQRYALYNHSLRMMIAEVWDTPATRVQSPVDLDEHSYDIAAYLPGEDRELLMNLVRHEIESTLHIVVEKEPTVQRVYVLTATKLSSQTQASKEGTQQMSRADSGSAIGTAQTMKELAATFEREINSPVLDETGIAGTFDYSAYSKLEGRARVIDWARQLGLELTDAVRPINMLVVRKTQ